MAPEPDAVATYLERIRAVTDAATQGPWEHPLDNEVTYGYRTDGSRHIATWIATVGEGDEDVSEEQNDANADFIAAARSYVPALLAAVEAVLARHQPKTVTVYTLCEAHRILGIRDAAVKAEIDACCWCAGRQQVTCTGCDSTCPGGNLWEKCPERAAITRELLGEEADRG